MKKLLASLLVLCMIAAIIPAFSVSAEAPQFSDIESGYTEFSSTVSFNAGSSTCGFLDGNLAFTSDCTGYVSPLEKNDTIYIYINGVLADFNTNHTRKTSDTNFMFAIYNATYNAGDTLDITFVFSDTMYYTTATATAPMNSIGYTDATAIVKGGKAAVEVTFASSVDVATLFFADDTIDARVHDDHTVRTFTITEVEGQKVTFKCDSFSTSKTLLEFGYATTDKLFCVTIDENYGGGTLEKVAADTLDAYIQIKDGATEELTDIRFLLAGNYSFLNDIVLTATATITFKKGTETVKTYTKALNDYSYFYEVSANNDYFYAAADDCLFGNIITNVPATDWSEVTLTVNNVTANVYTGSAINDSPATINLAYTKLDGETGITTSGNNGGSANEGPSMLFDDNNETKYGDGDNNNDCVITLAWNYDAPHAVTAYIITTANDTASSNPLRNPLYWTLYGSTDGETWEVIDDVTDPKMEKVNFTSYGYLVDAPTEYQYYKIAFKKELNAYFQLAGLDLFEATPVVAE